MPGMDGHEVFRRVRGGTGLAGFPVIFLTGRSSTSSMPTWASTSGW